MGTRSLTRINTSEHKYLNLYRQMDGYPSGHGKELFEFLDGMGIVNGIGGDMPEKFANGPGCLAAQLVAHFKTGIGSIYLEPTAMADCGQDYEYIIDVVNDGSLLVKVKSGSRTPFSGSVEEFGKFCAKQDD